MINSVFILLIKSWENISSVSTKTFEEFRLMNLNREDQIKKVFSKELREDNRVIFIFFLEMKNNLIVH